MTEPKKRVKIMFENKFKDLDTKGKLKRILIITFLSLLFMFIALVILAICLDDPVETKIDPSLIGKGEAFATCIQVYKDNAKYGAKIGLLSPYTITLIGDTWYLKIVGKLKNQYGTLLDVECHCEVYQKRIVEESYSTDNVKAFEYNIK